MINAPSSRTTSLSNHGLAKKASNSKLNSNSISSSTFRSNSKSNSISSLNFPRSQSFTISRSASLNRKPNQAPIGQKPTKPRVVKKYVPGPHGLMAVDVIEETPAQNTQHQKHQPPKSRSMSFTKNKKYSNISENSSLRSFGSANSSSLHNKKEIEEKHGIQFVEKPETIDIIKEEDENIDDDIVKAEKELAALKLKKQMLASQEIEINSKPNDIKTVENFDVDEDITREEIEVPENFHETSEEVEDVQEEKSRENKDENENATEISKANEHANANENEGKVGIVEETVETEVVEETKEVVEPKENALPTDEHSDSTFEPPSTAKSTDTAASSILTTDTDSTKAADQVQIQPSTSSRNLMAQHLRPTIKLASPKLPINQNEILNSQDNSNSSTNELSNNSSSVILENDKNKRLSTFNPSPVRKSALKIKSSTSTIHLDDNNPANAAYLSLTTAENTRLNALATKPSNSSTSNNSNTLSRSNSNRYSLRADNGEKLNGFKKYSTPAAGAPQQTNQRVNNRPQSVVNPRGMGPPQNPPQYQQHQPSPSQQNTSNLAALNAAKKTDEILNPLQKVSSFEKDRPAERNAAFKRKSLRDPAINPINLSKDSQLGYYRNQANQKQRANRNSQQIAQQQQQQQAIQQQNIYSNGFKSRFSDSDSDLNVPVGNSSNNALAPPQAPGIQGLKKPRSQYTLRSASEVQVSPAKSLPDQNSQQHHRFFSEAGHQESAASRLRHTQDVNHPEKKSNFKGKLRKLFGRRD